MNKMINLVLIQEMNNRSQCSRSATRKVTYPLLKPLASTRRGYQHSFESNKKLVEVQKVIAGFVAFPSEPLARNGLLMELKSLAYGSLLRLTFQCLRRHNVA